MQLEGEQGRIAGAHEGFADDLLDGAGKRSNGNRIPDLQENGFRPVGEPIKFGIGVLDGDEGILRANQRAFFHSFDAQRQNSTVFRVKILPAGVIKTFRVTAEVFVGEFPSFLDVFGGKDFAGKIRF